MGGEKAFLRENMDYLSGNPHAEGFSSLSS